MRLIADAHISPRTVQFLNSSGHDVVAIQSILPANSPDRDIVRTAIELDRVILTQDLDFSGILALTRATKPSLVTLRLSRPLVDNVNLRLRQVLPTLEDAVVEGVIATVEDDRVRVRPLPL